MKDLKFAPSFNLDNLNLTTLAKMQSATSLLLLCKASAVKADGTDLYVVEEYAVPEDFDFENEEQFIFTKVTTRSFYDYALHALDHMAEIIETDLSE